MSDIFISYNHNDKTKAEFFAHAFEQAGWSVFWDKDIPPGQTFDQYIGEQLQRAKCIVVLWSEESVHSDWVKEEAQRGVQRQILVPVLIDEVPPPLGFGRIEAAVLFDWKGDAAEGEFQNLLKAIEKLIPHDARVETGAGQTASPVVEAPPPRSATSASIEKEPSISPPPSFSPAASQKNTKYVFGGFAVVAVLLILFFVWQGWRETPRKIGGLGVLLGSDTSLQAAQDEITRASKKGIPKAKLYFRNGYYVSIAVVGNKETAQKSLTIAKTFRPDARIVKMDTWCRKPQPQNGFVVCQDR
jgi:hypothetical protein